MRFVEVMTQGIRMADYLPPSVWPEATTWRTWSSQFRTTVGSEAVSNAAGNFETINRANLRMITRREDLCFALKTRHALGTGGQRGGQYFESDFAA
jgi:hypothetical protein